MKSYIDLYLYLFTFNPVVHATYWSEFDAPIITPPSHRDLSDFYVAIEIPSVRLSVTLWC